TGSAGNVGTTGSAGNIGTTGTAGTTGNGTGVAGTTGNGTGLGGSSVITGVAGSKGTAGSTGLGDGPVTGGCSCAMDPRSDGSSWGGALGPLGVGRMWRRRRARRRR